MKGKTLDYIYGVTTGSYSSYRVLCLVGSKKEAEVLARRMRAVEDGWHSDANVEAFAKVTSDIEQASVLKMRVTLWDDGTRTDFDSHIDAEWPFDPKSNQIRAMKWRWVRAPIHANKGGRLEVEGTDHELVKKTFSEKRAQLEAEDAMRLKKTAKGRV